MGSSGALYHFISNFREFALEPGDSVRHPSMQVVSVLRSTLALAVLSFPMAASAEPGAETTRVRARAVLQPAGLAAGAGLVAAPEAVPAELVTVPSAEGLAEVEPETESRARRKASPRRCLAATSCSYKSLLGELVITRDLEIPGAEGMAVRLFPTSSALAGDDSRAKIVLRPRVEGSGSAYGLHLAARF